MPSFHEPSADHCLDDHEGYVAGRDRAGFTSGSWTDVRTHPPGTYAVLLARCSCGWTGPAVPADGDGAYGAAERSWRELHLAVVLADCPPPSPPTGISWIDGGYVPENGSGPDPAAVRAPRSSDPAR